MKLNSKIKKAIDKNKKYFITFAILWLVLVIVFVAPLVCSMKEAVVLNENTGTEAFDFGHFLLKIGDNITHPFASVGKSLTPDYAENFRPIFTYFTGIYLVLVVVGIIRAAPKTEYADIEHGSSDWSENGEQYKVLSKKDGIILAENNYLPLNKMGNINALIVGRIWIW